MLDIAFAVSPDAPGYADLRDEFFSNYEAGMLSNTTVFEGVPHVIEALLARGLRWGVVTNKSSRFTDPLTRSIALFFDGFRHRQWGHYAVLQATSRAVVRGCATHGCRSRRLCVCRGRR